MSSFKDKTFCASPECKNECGRKMTIQEMAEICFVDENEMPNPPVSWAYFCGEPEKVEE